MPESEKLNGLSHRSSASLSKIADALGCAVSMFSEGASFEPAETAELIRLWLNVEHERDRAKILSFIRTLAPEPSGK